MDMPEQNISGVKLEKLRVDALKKLKIRRRVFPVCMIVFTALVLAGSLPYFLALAEHGWEDMAVQGIVFSLLSRLMMAAILSCAIYLILSSCGKRPTTVSISASKTNMCWTPCGSYPDSPTCAIMRGAVSLTTRWIA